MQCSLSVLGKQRTYYLNLEWSGHKEYRNLPHGFRGASMELMANSLVQQKQQLEWQCRLREIEIMILRPVKFSIKKQQICSDSANTKQL